MKLIGLLQITMICLLITFTVEQSRKTQQIFKPSWLNYIKNQNNDSNKYFIISNPITKYQVHFNLNNPNNIKAKQISISQQNIWKAQYQQQGYLSLLIHGKGQEGIIQIDYSEDKQTNFIIKKNNKNSHSFIYISTNNNLSRQSFKQIHQICQINQKEQQQIICNFSSKKEDQKIFLLFSQKHQFDQILQFKNKMNDQIFLKFIMKQKIQEIQNFTLKFVEQMLTYSLQSICYEQSQYNGFGFYGLCSNNNREQIERHYSLLVLDILFNYNENLSMWLVQNYLNLLEQKLFYSFRQNQWIPISQHTQVFKTYLKRLYANTLKLTDLQIQNRKNLVIQVQNGLLNKLLLSQVNHLSEQINYRQTKTIHPTLLKMLTQAWKYSSSRAKVLSVYQQSFTNDFYYHAKNQKLDSSVGKMAWLLKLLYEHIDIIQKYGDFIQKQSLEQILSLSRVISGYMLDQPKAKQGIFSSIIIQQKIKVYTRSLGYQSLLPFTYDITNNFPLIPIYNLTTQYGLSSYPLKSQNVDERYDFRGNIHLYFNYKILFSMLHRGIEKPKIRPFTEGAVFVIESVQKLIKQIYQNNKIDQLKQKFATSWTFEGKIKKSQKYLALLNAIFMNDISQFKQSEINKKNVQSK